MVTQVFNRARVRGLAARNPAADVKPGCLVKQPLRPCSLSPCSLSPCSLSPCSLNQANFLTRVPNLGKGARTGEPFLDVRPRSRRSHRCGEYGLPADEAVSMAGAKLESGGVTLEREATLKCLLTGGLVWALLLQVPGEAGGMVPLVPLAGPANSPEATHLRPRNQKCRASRLASLLHKIGPQVRFCVPRERTRFLLLRSLGEARQPLTLHTGCSLGQALRRPHSLCPAAGPFMKRSLVTSLQAQTAWSCGWRSILGCVGDADRSVCPAAASTLRRRPGKRAWARQAAGCRRGARRGLTVQRSSVVRPRGARCLSRFRLGRAGRQRSAPAKKGRQLVTLTAAQRVAKPAHDRRNRRGRRGKDRPDRPGTWRCLFRSAANTRVSHRPPLMPIV